MEHFKKIPRKPFNSGVHKDIFVECLMNNSKLVHSKKISDVKAYEQLYENDWIILLGKVIKGVRREVVGFTGLNFSGKRSSREVNPFSLSILSDEDSDDIIRLLLLMTASKALSKGALKLFYVFYDNKRGRMLESVLHSLSDADLSPRIVSSPEASRLGFASHRKSRVTEVLAKDLLSRFDEIDRLEKKFQKSLRLVLK